MSQSFDNAPAAAVSPPAAPSAAQRVSGESSRTPGRLRLALTGDRWLIGIVLAGAIVRFATLSTQSLWADEGFTAQIVGHGLSSAISQVPRTESTPPLYYALAWIWSHLFGTSAYALRSLPALFGSLTVAAAYWVGIATGGRRPALVAAALTAVAPIMVWYSQEARAYALLVLLCTLALGFFVRALTDPRRAWILGWAVCSAAALATHYFAVFPLVAQAAWLVVAVRPRRDVLAALVAPVIMGAALVPLLLYQQAHVPRPWTSIFTVKDQLEAIGQSFLVGISWTPIIHRVGVAVVALLAAAAVLALVRDGRRDERRVGLCWAALAAATIGAPVVISLLGTNYLAPRNVLYAWPILALLVAAGAGRRTAGHGAWAGVVFGCAACLAIVVAVPATPRLQRDDWRDLLHPLRTAQIGRGVIVVDGFQDEPVIRYYLPGFSGSAHPTDVREVDVVTPTPRLAQAARSLPGSGLTPEGTRVRGGIALERFLAPGGVTLPASPPPGSGERFLVHR